MAKLNLDYYSGDNQYSDGDIEDEILEIAKSGKQLEKLGKVEFPILYHLSKVRENILNWYPFKQNATCLEIGSGCGAISGLLCEKTAKVVSVDLSKRRADINYARHEKFDNLEIMVGNLNDMNFTEQFDYVVINGVFEYAMSFTKGEQPYEDFLNFAASFLKPDGILLVAIENRLGLKYFAGAPEDHTDAYMDGLKGYPENDSVRTFSKAEWQELMNYCGFKDYKFYYPYPDYKFPCEIFTDETLISQKYGRKSWNFTEYRFELFPEQEMAATFRKEGVIDHFANSFLIEMSKEKIEREREVLYAKVNQDRDERFAIATLIEKCADQKQVVKQPLNPLAKKHIERLFTNGESDNRECALLKGTKREDTIVYPWLTKNSFGYEAEQAITAKEPDKVQALVAEVYQRYLVQTADETEYDSEAFREVFGEVKLAENHVTQCISPANIDVILDNIFPDGETLHIIDGEWVFDFPVPISFITWRIINEIYSNCPWFEQQRPRQEFMAEYDITETMEQVFWEWSTHFALTYVGANRLAEYAIPEIGIGLAEIRTRRSLGKWLDSTLYLDTGKGFSEAESVKIRTRIEAGNKVKVTFELADISNVKALRFDPLEGTPCYSSLRCKGMKMKPFNAEEQKQGKDFFLTTDPSYLLEWKGTLFKKLEIEGVIEVVDKDIALQEAQRLLASKKRRMKFWR